MKTIFLLMARYEAAPVIPIEQVQKDFFPHIEVRKLIARCTMGEIPLPLVRTDPKSQKSHKGVMIQDLAAYIDTRHEAATKELRQMRAVG